MKHFIKLTEGIDVAALLTQLDGQPDLWRVNPERLTGDSPHRETSDIWVRYRDQRDLTRPESHLEAHFSVWYPAWRALPALHSIVFHLSALVESVHLGGILITRLPPGGTIYEHDDRGSWHSAFHNTKVWMALRANDQCLNHCADETIIMEPGAGWTFDNLKPHSVRNSGETERLCLICCFRTEP